MSMTGCTALAQADRKKMASFDIEAVLWMFLGMVPPHVDRHAESYRLAMFLTGRNSITQESLRIIYADAKRRLLDLCDTNHDLKVILNRLGPLPEKYVEADQSYLASWMKRRLGQFAREMPVTIVL